MTPPVKNQVYTAEITGYSSEGLGIARIGGQVVFVHNAILGEVCDILVMKVLKNTAYGKAVAWQSVSPHRVEPDCPYYRRCGGCAFRHMDYAGELEAKRQRVQDALRRDADRVREWVKKGAIVRVCGSRSMAHDVAQTLDTILAPLHLSVSQLHAKERYAEDVF